MLQHQSKLLAGAGVGGIVLRQGTVPSKYGFSGPYGSAPELLLAGAVARLRRGVGKRGTCVHRAGSGPLSLEAQWQAGVAQVNQQGPLATDLMRLLTGAQGTMGVVVWASIKCELLPGARKCVAVTAPNLESLVDFCCRIERFRLGDEVLILNRRLFAAALGKCAGGASRSGLPEWSVLIGLAGTALYPQEKVDVQEHEFGAAARQFGLESVEGASNAEIMSCLESLSPTPHWKLAAKGGCQDVFFLTTLDKVPQFVRTVEEVAGRHGYPASGIGAYVQPQHQGVSQHVEFSFPFDPASRSEVETVKAVYSAVSQTLIEQGAYFRARTGSGRTWSTAATPLPAACCGR